MWRYVLIALLLVLTMLLAACQTAEERKAACEGNYECLKELVRQSLYNDCMAREYDIQLAAQLRILGIDLEPPYQFCRQEARRRLP